MKDQPECPECEKLIAVSEKSNELGDFLEWIKREHNIVLCRWEENDDEDTKDFMPDVLIPCSEFRGHSGIEKLLASYFKIDMDKVEKERMAILDFLREAQS